MVEGVQQGPVLVGTFFNSLSPDQTIRCMTGPIGFFFTHSRPHHTTHTTHTQTQTMSHLIIPFVCLDITL